MIVILADELLTNSLSDQFILKIIRNFPRTFNEGKF